VPDTPGKPMEKLGQPDKEKPVAATVVVKASLDVQIKFNGALARRSAEEQAFATPDLERGQNYSYQVTAEAVRDGKAVTATRKVLVKAGEVARVDFSDLRAVTTDAAHVTVIAPPGARVFVDNFAVKLHGDRATFDTPALEPGKTYFYTIKAELDRDGKADSESQRVLVQAGKAVTVEFKKLNAALTVRR
jgi:uncharacterized protein (TIGR03000 family)